VARPEHLHALDYIRRLTRFAVSLYFSALVHRALRWAAEIRVRGRLNAPESVRRAQSAAGAFNQEAAMSLSPAEIERFEVDGFLVVKGAFARDDALTMQSEWWSELANVYDIRRDDQSTWRQPARDLRRAKLSPVQATIATPRVRGVIDDLLGPDAWLTPKHWGRVITTFPVGGDWSLPAGLWHWDSPCAWHRDAMNGLLVAIFVGAVETHGGGTLLLAGSHRLLLKQEAALARDGWRGHTKARRELFYRSHPWLMALTGVETSLRDRIASSMENGTTIDGIPIRVVELTGEPGDMVFCHPTLVHCVSPNHGTQPRFMRIAMLQTLQLSRVRATGRLNEVG